MPGRVSVGAAQLTRAERLARVLERIHANEEEWQRFRRGFYALFRGLRDEDGGRRIRLFIQALEGLIKPPIGESRRRFVHRCRTTIAQAGAGAEQTLGQMYDIRSYVEHLHPPLDALAGVPAADRLEVGRRRTRQGELLARFAFMHVLESPDLVVVFRSEDRMDEFWSRPDDERARLWGERLDLEAVP